VIELKWEGVGYLASDIFPIVEHVHNITNLPTLIVGYFVLGMMPGSEMSASSLTTTAFLVSRQSRCKTHIACSG
jgi:hypothetical protein